METNHETTIELAILVPANSAADVKEAIANLTLDPMIQQNAPVSASKGELVSGFDPMTVGGFMWIAIKCVAPVAGAFVGGVAMTGVTDIAAKVISDIVWKKIEERNKAKTFELPVRFRSGKRFTFKSRTPEGIENLRKALQENVDTL